MILRILINFARWSWGFPSLKVPETVSPEYEFLLGFGLLIDIAVISGVGLLIFNWKKNREDERKYREARQRVSNTTEPDTRR